MRKRPTPETISNTEMSSVSETDFRTGAAQEHKQTIEKMDDIVFEKTKQELLEFKSGIETEIKDLEEEVEEFCREEEEMKTSAETEVTSEVEKDKEESEK